ncbi:MAG: inositol oxygenase family protein, partial [Phycisphaerae bacterium]
MMTLTVSALTVAWMPLADAAVAPRTTNVDVVLGLVHDLGKVLQCYGERPEFVVGDIFPLGCAFSTKIQYAE